MNELQIFVINTVKKLDAGDLSDFPDPAEPTLGGALTQAEIDTLKKLVKELNERYPTT